MIVYNIILHAQKSHGLSSAPDAKLLLVPVIFMALRIWSVIVDISTYYLSPVDRAHYRLSYASAVIGALEVRNMPFSKTSTLS